MLGLPASSERLPGQSLPRCRQARCRRSTLVRSGVVVGALTLVLVVSLVRPSLARNRVTMGVTFSPRHAAGLGLDPRTTYRRMLDELPFDDIRLPIYWDEVEKDPGVYDLSAVEWYVAEAAQRDVNAIPVLGYKVPRWPECHPPAWARHKRVDEKRAAILDLVRVEIEQLRAYRHITLWQIENEPFFPFGECDAFAVLDESFVAREVALARQLDSRPVLITDSGELSPWIGALRSGDRFGSSLYRSIWFERIGLLKYPLSPDVYAVKDRVARAIAGVEGESIVAELQAEPWFMTGGPLTDVPLAQQLAMFPLGTLRDHVRFARETGASTIYLWGVEWWYWMEQHEHPEYVQEIRDLLADVRQHRPGR